MTQNTRTTHDAGRAIRRGVVLLIAALALAVSFAVARPLWEDAGQQGLAGGDSARAAGWVPSYSADVSPILSRSCYRCHGPDRSDKGLRLDSYQRVMAGDSYGAILIPGDSSLSAMVLVVKNGTMPHESTKLTAAEIDTLSKWIDAGAPQN